MAVLTSIAVYREYRYVTAGGAGAGVLGFHGSLSPKSTDDILRELSVVEGQSVFDFGAGKGTFLLAAAAKGARSTGIELAQNLAYQIVFTAVREQISRKFQVQLDAELHPGDIDQVF